MTRIITGPKRRCRNLNLKDEARFHFALNREFIIEPQDDGSLRVQSHFTNTKLLVDRHAVYGHLTLRIVGLADEEEGVVAVPRAAGKV